MARLQSLKGPMLVLAARLPRVDLRREMLRWSLGPFAVLALVGCCGQREIAGRYSGQSSGGYQLEGQPPVDLHGLDQIEVRQTSRHYQYATLEVRVRDCVLRSEPGSDDSWALGGECRVAGPDGVPSVVKVSGGLSRSRGGVHLSLGGGDAQVRRFGYRIDATPAP